MSLIQEALRRQQEDMDVGADGAKPKTPNTPPPSPQESPRIARKIQSGSVTDENTEPPPVQQPPQVESEEPPPPPPPDESDEGASAKTKAKGAAGPGTKPGMKVTLIVIGVVLCLAFGIWAISFAIQTWKSDDSAEQAVASPDDSPAEPTPATAPVAAPKNIVDVPAVVEPAEIQHQPEIAEEPVPAPVVVEPVIWPMLTINGLVGKGEQGAAMINNQIVGVNESIEGATVIDIKKQGVTLEFEGEKKFVKVGGSSE